MASALHVSVGFIVGLLAAVFVQSGAQILTGNVKGDFELL